MKRVLIATDLSAEADEGIRQGDLWARALEARLVFHHVLPAPATTAAPMLPDLALPGPEDAIALHTQAAAMVRRRVADVTDRPDGDYEVVVEPGTPRIAIPALADALGADLVVVGSHGRGRVLGAVLGSVADAVIRHAHGAVLVARPSPPSGRVLAATDFSDPALPAIRTAAGFSSRLLAHLTVLHCIEEPPTWAEPMAAGALTFETWPAEVRAARQADARARIVAAMESTGALGEPRVSIGPASTEIVRAAKDLDAQLVVVGTVGRTGLRRMLLGNTAEAVVRNAPCSFLVERLHRPDF